MVISITMISIPFLFLHLQKTVKIHILAPLPQGFQHGSLPISHRLIQYYVYDGSSQKIIFPTLLFGEDELVSFLTAEDAESAEACDPCSLYHNLVRLSPTLHKNRRSLKAFCMEVFLFCMSVRHGWCIGSNFNI